jgi:lysophospholipase L1-like esterase
VWAASKIAPFDMGEPSAQVRKLDNIGGRTTDHAKRIMNDSGIERRKRRLMIKWLLLIVVSISLFSLTVFVFEFLFNPYKHLPLNGIVDGKLYTWGHVVENNKHGFRERDFKSPKPADTYRIMVLGDSLTWGAGLAVEERYTAIAEKLLNNAFPQKKFEVLNFGIFGGPTTTERDILEKFKLEVNPDLIVVGFCLNDPQPKRHDWSIEREKLSDSLLGRSIHHISHFLAGQGLFYTGKLLNDAFYRSAQRWGLIPNAQTALGRAYDPVSNEWHGFIQALQDIKRTSDQLNLPPPIFAVLSQGQLHTEIFKVWSQWYHQAEKAAANIGFISYNHEFEIAHQLENESLIINKLDGHPSASVNRIYGEKLYQVIATTYSSN